ncbi:hypothetical protein V8E54_000522 [Elaphomyces granulatus]
MSRAFIKRLLNFLIPPRLALTLPPLEGPRASDDQSKLKASMMKDYCGVKKSSVWEPVGRPAHSYCRSPFSLAKCRYDGPDLGKGSIDDIFSPRNGLLLHKHIESALDKGYLAIVPDVDIAPQYHSMPEMDQAARRDRLKEWERVSLKSSRQWFWIQSHKRCERRPSPSPTQSRP